ncbi:MAG: beta-ketoacyl synthase chain length factor [Elusimicrobiota bacterium]|jgi:4-coumarate--CoA ligase (photoactive yellow protein activation family)|nr:beta-ketoacyl synthase chain length factor [Elusimicrobiota bacterium]
MNKLFVLDSYCAQSYEGLENFFAPQKMRRLGILSKVSLYCAAKLLDNQNIDLHAFKQNIGLIIATSFGPISQTLSFMDSIIFDGDILASPITFSSSVHNAIETTITTSLNLQGPVLTISDCYNSFLSSLATAQCWLASQMCQTVLLGAADERHPICKKEFGQKAFFATGAAFFLLTLSAGKKFIVKNITDPLNPADYAFNLSKKYQCLLSKKDISKIVADLIKTYLASKKIKTMDVFDTPKISDLFLNIDEKIQNEIFEQIKKTFLIDSEISKENLLEQCFISYQKNEQFVFSTSGSTGQPLQWRHSFAQIREEVKGVASIFSNIKRIVCTVPTHHSYGFIFGLQLAKFLNIDIIYQAPLPTLLWRNFLKAGDLLITFPLFLKYLKNIDFKFNCDVKVLTSTSPCPDTLMDDVIKMGAADITDIYGSSESGAIAFRKAGDKSFKLFDFWEYEAKDMQIEKIYRKDTNLEVVLPDIAKLKSERNFYICGRIDQAVQVAGINVYPQKLEQILRGHDFVKEVSVRLGEKRLKAFIVLKEGVNFDEAKRNIYAYINKNLDAHHKPESITFGKNLPQTPFGKKADW